MPLCIYKPLVVSASCNQAILRTIYANKCFGVFNVVYHTKASSINDDNNGYFKANSVVLLVSTSSSLFVLAICNQQVLHEIL